MEASEDLEKGLVERDFEQEIRQWKTWSATGLQLLENHLLGKEYEAALKLVEEMKREALR